MSAVRVVVVGLSCLDHIWQVEHFPPRHSRTRARDYRVQGGGPAATAAVTLARLGAQAELWALHGDDANGRMARAELESFGVDCRGLRTLPGAKTLVSAVLVDPGGERYIFPFRGENLTDEADGLELSGLEGAACLLTDLRHPVMARAALVAARERGIPTVGDVSNTRHWELTGLLDHLIVSEECAVEVLGRDDPEAALAALKQSERQQVGITLGPQGYLFELDGQIRHLPAFPVTAVDTTGAGDVFHGAYAYGVAMGWGAEDRARFAAVTAALACEGLGRSAIPEAERVHALLERRTLRELDERSWN